MEQRPLHFLLVTADRFPPFRPEASILFGKELLRRGHRIDWVLQAESAGSPVGLVDWRGCRAWVARTVTGKGRMSRVYKHLLGLANDARAVGLVLKQPYDFVQVKDKFLAALLLLPVAKLRRRPFVFWLSFPYPEASLLRAREQDAKYPIFYLVRGWLFKVVLYRFICRFADHVFVQSDEMKRSMSKQGVAESKMTPVPMGVDMADYPAGDPASLAAQNSTIVYLGSLGRARKLEFLIDAFALVVRRLPAARLLLVGEGDEPEDRPHLATYARQAGVANSVTFTGFLVREQAVAQVATAAVGASPIPPTPMYDVASPTKILEYMAAGLAVVANDQPDQKIVLEQSKAGLCTPYDAQAFAAALVEILGDPAQARRMGERGRKYVEERRSYNALASLVERRYFTLVGVPSTVAAGSAEEADRRS